MSESRENTAPDGRRDRVAALAWLAAMIVVAAIATYPGLLVAPNHWDSCLFVWQGKRLLAGDLPYVTAWDQKLPVLLWIDALAAASGHVYGALYAIEVVAIGVGGWLIARLARRQLGNAAAAAAGLAYVTLASTLSMLDTGNMSETYAAPFAIAFSYATVRHAEGARRRWLWPLLGGLALGTAVMLRPPAILVAAALVPLVPAMRRSGGWCRAAGLASLGGLLVVPLSTVVWAASKGILGAMLESCIVHNLAYAAGAGVPGSASWSHVGRTLQSIAVQTWVWHLAGLVGLFIVLLGAGSAKAEANSSRRVELGGMVAVWLGAAFASALPSLQLYVHYYYLTVAPLALLSAWAWRELTVRLQGPGRQAVSAWALATVAALFVVLQIGWDYGEAAERQRRAQPVTEMERFLGSHGRAGDTLAVFGWGIEMDLLARLGWPSPTRHPHAIIYPGLPGGAERLREWSHEMVRTPPVWLVCSERQDLVQGAMVPVYGWDARALEIAQPVFREFKERFVEAARFPNRQRRGASEPAYYVVYRDRTVPGEL